MNIADVVKKIEEGEKLSDEEMKLLKKQMKDEPKDKEDKKPEEEPKEEKPVEPEKEEKSEDDEENKEKEEEKKKKESTKPIRGKITQEMIDAGLNKFPHPEDPNKVITLDLNKEYEVVDDELIIEEENEKDILDQKPDFLKEMEKKKSKKNEEDDNKEEPKEDGKMEPAEDNEEEKELEEKCKKLEAMYKKYKEEDEEMEDCDVYKEMGDEMEMDPKEVEEMYSTYMKKKETIKKKKESANRKAKARLKERLSDQEEEMIKTKFLENNGFVPDPGMMEEVYVYGKVSPRDLKEGNFKKWYPEKWLEDQSDDFYPNLVRELEKANAETYFNWAGLFSDEEINGNFNSDVINGVFVWSYMV